MEWARAVEASAATAVVVDTLDEPFDIVFVLLTGQHHDALLA